MEDACEAAVIHEGLRQGAGVQGDGGYGSGGCPSGKMSPARPMSSGSSSSLFSSTSSLTDEEDERDDATSSTVPGCRPISSSSSSSLTSWGSSDTMQTDGVAAGGPLYALSPLLDHLPTLRTGLSKYYQGRSQSFTSLADVGCMEDLAKKATPYVRRTKASRCCTAALGAKNQLSKTIAKKAQRGSPDILSRARNTSQLLCSSGKPPAYHSKTEVYRC